MTTHRKSVKADAWKPPNRKRLATNRKNYLVPLNIDWGIIQVTPSPLSRVVMLRFTRPDDPTPVHLIFNPKLLGRMLKELAVFLDDAFPFNSEPNIDVQGALQDEYNRIQDAEAKAKARAEAKAIAEKLERVPLSDPSSK